MARIITATAAEAHLPIQVWARDVPAGALAQLKAIASQPYVVEHIAAMPDLHVANGVAVGTVFATESTIVPGALGADLGCGMSAIRFDFAAATLSRDDLRTLLATLANVIPVGDAVHRGRGQPLPSSLLETPLSTSALEHARARLGPKHLGTLGGGNHFLELNRDAGGDLWLLLHSGSRGLGAGIAEHHLRVARTPLGGLDAQQPEGHACLNDIDWALQFAKANRDALLRQASMVIEEFTHAPALTTTYLDVHHNFVRAEVHFGRQLLVHRKGAIAAPAGERALIPGSMGTSSYLVEGLGEPRSFSSASHGAGRVMTRKEARQGIRPAQLTHRMRRVVFDERRAAALVEEAPEAYRDLREVLDDEDDLVRPVLRLEPIAVLKG